MKIIRRKTDNVVIFVGAVFELLPSGLIGNGFSAPNVTSEKHDILDVDSIPNDWRGGWYSYDVEWKKTDQWQPSEHPPAIEERFTDLKSEFESYIYGHYGPATQMTILKAYSDEDTPPDLKAKAKEVGDWIKTIQAYYKVVKSDVLGGNVTATWDFQQFDATKPQWDFEDFV